MKIHIPELKIQEEIISEIEVLEAQIATAKQIIENAPAQKGAVLKKWLE